MAEKPKIEYRCTECDKLIIKANINGEGTMQYKCGRCGHVGEIKVSFTEPLSYQERIFLNRKHNKTK